MLWDKYISKFKRGDGEKKIRYLETEYLSEQKDLDNDLDKCPYRRYVEVKGKRYYRGFKRVSEKSEVPSQSDHRTVKVGDKTYYFYSVVRIRKKIYPVKRKGILEYIELDDKESTVQ